MIFPPSRYGLLALIPIVFAFPSDFTDLHQPLSDVPEDAPLTEPLPPGGPRAVSVITLLYVLGDSINPITGTRIFATTSSLYIESDGQNGAFLIELGEDHVTRIPVIRTVDYGLYGRYDGKAPPGGTLTNVRQGYTDWSNQQFMNVERGTGVVADVWSEDPYYRNKPDDFVRYNDANAFVKKLLDRMQIPLQPSSAEAMIENRNVQANDPSVDEEEIEVTNYVREDTVNGDAAVYKLRDFTVKIDTPPPSVKAPKTFRVRWPQQFLDAFAKFGSGGDTGLSGTADQKTPAPGGDTSTPEGTARSTSLADTSGMKASFFGRINGVLSGFAVKEGMAVLGAGGSVLGAGALVASVAFIVIDFVHGEWLGGALATFGLALGLAVGTAIAASSVEFGTLGVGATMAALAASGGPVGLLVAGLVGFFAVLPSFFIQKKKIPRADDSQAIIQWSFFGDAEHTGNEVCRAHNATYHGNPNCTAAYGPNLIARALNIDIFDAVIFLEEFNYGLPMSIVDMGNSFDIVDPTQRDLTKDSRATIDCGNRWAPYDNGGDFDDPDADSCPHPKYFINRAKIFVPGANQTADKVKDRIIPAPGGDCRLVTFPGPQNFPIYNISVTGLPCAVSCKLSASLNVSGMAVAADANGRPDFAANGHTSNGQTAALLSPGNSSSDGITGDSRAPPLQVDFLPIFNSTTAVCLKDTQDRQLCLPPGSYDPPSGHLGPSTKDISTLTLPASGGATFQTHYTIHHPKHGKAQDIHHNYTTNISPTQPSQADQASEFAEDMAILGAGNNKNITDTGITISYPPGNPAYDAVTKDYFCLFSGLKTTGDVLCLGLGGTMLPTPWQKQAMSVQVPPGVGYELYVQSYADAGGARFTGSADDLSETPYGTKGSFAKNVVAAWVYKM